MGAEALRQPLAKTRKSGLSHFFDTLKPRRDIPPGLLLLGKGRGKSRFPVLFSFQKYFTVAQGKEHMLSFFHMAFQQFHGG